MGRLKPMICLLLALLVCGASTQAKVCELSCALDMQGAACRMAVAFRQAAMQEMARGQHCSPASRTARGAVFSGLHPSICGHAFSPDVEDVPTAKVRFASSRAALVQSRSNELAIRPATSFARKRPLPPPLAATPVVLALRI